MVRVAQRGRCISNSDRAKDNHRPGGSQVSRFQRLYILGLGIGLVFAILHSPPALSQNTPEWVATLKSVEGKVEAQRTAKNEWLPAALNDTFTIGDSIRVLAYSRAAILLPDETVLRLDQNTTVTFTEPQDDTRSWLELLKGALHIISRDPRALKVITPFAGAGLEGTEFFIEVTQDETIVSVYEGEVSVSTDAGDVNVMPGERVTARAGLQPLVQLSVRPRDAVQWTLYYAPILDYEVFSADTDPGAEQIEDPLFYTGRAAKRLAVGRVDNARADIARALELDSTNVDALALQAIIAVAQNDTDSAFELANRALTQDADSSAAMIALSYAQQAIFDISGALITMQGAVERHPSNGLGWARLSELWLAVGDLNQSVGAARTAVSLDSNVARAQTVLGFAYLARIDIQKAKEAFNAAIVLDQAAPLPRLGLGLAMIRAGDLEGGRAEIEFAVILDSGNALIRSYMGKAYYEEKRDDLAASQLDMSKQLDPLDPTPLFYDAIRKQTINRPIEALDDLQESIERNHNRAIYRSSLKLDEDLAARSASLGRIYRDLGFEQRALVEGWKSTNADPSDFSGHRLLADTYSILPRHEVARVSELLQSQLLQPINISPIQPQLTATNLFVLNGAGPSSIGLNEFNPLFVSDGLHFLGNAVAGDDDSNGYDLVVSGISGRASFSIGAFGYETDGIRENNDQDRELFNIFAQTRLSTRTSLQVEYRKADSEVGDLGILFDPDNFSPNSRTQETSSLGRIGLHHEFAVGSDLIANLAYVDEDFDSEDFFTDPFFGSQTDTEFGFKERGRSAEIQHIYRRDKWNLTSGLGAFESDRKESTLIESDLPFPPFSFVIVDETLESDVSIKNIYAYANIKQANDITWTLGLSADYYEEDAFDRDQVNPKIGVSWNVTDKTTLRASAFRTLTRPLVASQTIEPTQVAGFNQFFDGVEGEEARKVGVAIDHRFSNRLFSGFEYSMRELKVPFELPSSVERFDWDEEFARAYLHWAITKRFALGVDYLFEAFERESSGGVERILELTTHSLPIKLSYFNPNGWTTRLIATYIDQEGEFDGLFPYKDGNNFKVVDMDISYRLPKRYGIVSLSVKNLFDEEFQFQDTDPANPRVVPERMAFLKLSLSF